MFITTATEEKIKVVTENFIYLPVKRAVFFENKSGRIAVGGGNWLYCLLHVQADLSFLFRPPDEERFYIQPGIFEKPANIFKEKNNYETTGNDYLYQVTSTPRVDVK